MNAEPDEPMPEVSKDKFYEVTDSLRETFISKAKDPVEQQTGGTFSLLAAFGRSGDGDEENETPYEGKSAAQLWIWPFQEYFVCDNKHNNLHNITAINFHYA